MFRAGDAGLAADGPGQRAGLQAGDVLLSFDAVPVAEVDDLHRGLTEERAGVSVALRLLPWTELVTLDVIPREM